MTVRRDRWTSALRLPARVGTGAAALALFVFVGLMGWNLGSTSAVAANPQAAVAQRSEAQPPAAAHGAGRIDSYADVVARVTPAVVTVQSERRARAVGYPFGGDEESILGQMMPNHPR